MATDIERSEGPFITKSGEFVYATDVETAVRKEQSYHIHYLKSKKVVYELDVNGELISRKLRVAQEVYNSVHNTQRDEYPVKHFPTAKNLSFKMKFINRTFAQSKLYPEAEVMEVVRKTRTSLYRFANIKWQISGALGQAKLYNKKQLMRIVRIFPTLAERIPVDQLHETKLIKTETSLEKLLRNPDYSEGQNTGEAQELI
tara:strand:+ start:1598 stop:2200 length:603 start_codon:yes stop_codon:yes gene_type:complete